MKTNENENRPAVIGNGQGEISLEMHNKDTKLSRRQKKVAELLITGKYSAADISIALHYSDPRSYIRELREKGINVLDEWIKSDDVRFKRYWITPEKKPEVSDAKSIGEILEENFGYLLNFKK
jgi:hypothetical protein